MKIGILTFHSQLNYGGVLQCWALQLALQAMGHDVQIIDRWENADNSFLECGYNHYGIHQWMHWALRVVFGCGDFSFWLRHRRTKHFIHSHLALTPYHFCNWPELCSSSINFDFDLIVVGSDQVWHGGKCGDPRPYLLEGAPNVPAISYAASFGTKTLPEGIDYTAGFKRFKAISVREIEGVSLVAQAGAKAVHVVDPTLLLQHDAWHALGHFKKYRKRVVCYVLGAPVWSVLNELEEWARKTDRQVIVISDGGCFLPFPKTPKLVCQRIGQMIHHLFCPPHIKIARDCGPQEFYQLFSESDECITDSFHAVMFSYICKCNLRVLSPNSAERKDMFSRIEEFVSTSVEGRVIVNSILDACSSLECNSRTAYNDSVIETKCKESKRWLETAIENAILVGR